MVDAALRAAGHRSARYTSPHLVDLSERFVIDGQAVAHDAMVSAVADVRDVVALLRADGTLEVQPTFFEVTTAVAFELFRRARVRVAVLEVGLGGRLDATNVVDPIATAITSIAFDHQMYLGDTLRAIALEKAGIIKPRVPVVLGPLEREAAAAIEQVAGDRGAEIIHATPEDASGFALGLTGRATCAPGSRSSSRRCATRRSPACSRRCCRASAGSSSRGHRTRARPIPRCSPTSHAPSRRGFRSRSSLASRTRSRPHGAN